MSPTIRPGTMFPRGIVRDRRGEPIDLSPIEPLLARLASAWNPLETWLFGSRARGEATGWSDWDLFVIVSDNASDDDIGHVASWRLAKDSGVRADVVACRASEFREDAGTPNTLAHEVATTGVLIHER